MQIEVSERKEVLVPDTRGGARPGAGRLPGGKNKRVLPGPDEVLRVLTSAEEKQQWRKLVQESEGNPKLKLEVLTRISELRRGKPFAATNPRQQRKPDGDRNLMIAIQNLMPGSKRLMTDDDKPQRRRKAGRK